MTQAAHAAELPPLPVRPVRWWPLPLWLMIWTALAFLLYKDYPHELINWYASIVWTLPFGISVIGICGAFISTARIKAEARKQKVGIIDDPLDVVLITRGKADVLGALTRVIRSLHYFNTHFRNYQVYIITDQGAEAINNILNLASQTGAQVLIVPKEYQTQRGTEFKARAAQYALEWRIKNEFGGDKANIPENHQTYNLDDDTSICEDTANGLARFVVDNRGPDGKYLAQGILTYKREHSMSLWMWLADAIRTADDLLRFPFTTGRGTPRAGLHGENMLVRTSVMAEIAWDFGPGEIVEDSRFALEFCKRYPRKSAWIPVRCYGATPVSSAQLASQRERWSEGMNHLAGNGTIPLRARWLVIHNMIVWSTGITQPIVTVAFLSWLIGDFNVAPVTVWIAPFWVISVSYTCWAYYEGLRANAHASGWKRPKLHHTILMLPGIILFSFLEGLGGTLGALRYLSGMKPRFDTIRKPI
jgi:egghead protein (zeste-white 4 protein)